VVLLRSAWTRSGRGRGDVEGKDVTRSKQERRVRLYRLFRPIASITFRYSSWEFRKTPGCLHTLVQPDVPQRPRSSRSDLLRRETAREIARAPRGTGKKVVEPREGPRVGAMIVEDAENPGNSLPMPG